MRKQSPPPVNAQMLGRDGTLNPLWLRWFQSIAVNIDARTRVPDLEYAADATLTTDDFGKVIAFDCEDAGRTCTLMTVSSKDKWNWITLVRLNGSEMKRLTIVPDENTRIENGSLGGRFWNDESGDKRAAANITLQLVSPTQWAIIGAMGIWRVR